ncbi:MAG TPA: class I SAM-dependent methyltransferase [Candidatus Thermoplasmatota archaeon]
MGLKHVRETYEAWGRDDPFHAVLTRPEYLHGAGDPEAFFRTGREEIGRLMAYLGELGLAVERGRALDFGCGVGRLSQALAEPFDEVIGVDISAPMVAKAAELNRHGERVRYLVNTGDDLALLDDGSFDFAYSSITLQHIPPRYVRRYVAEFFRVLRPGGVAVFQMRSGPRHGPGSLGELLYTLNREHFRRFLQRLRGKPTYEIHYLARSEVEEVVARSGGRMVDVVDVSGKGRTGRSFRYCAVR